MDVVKTPLWTWTHALDAEVSKVNKGMKLHEGHKRPRLDSIVIHALPVTCDKPIYIKVPLEGSNCVRQVDCSKNMPQFMRYPPDVHRPTPKRPSLCWNVNF